MFSFDSYAGARPIGGDRRPRQQMQYTGYGQQGNDDYEPYAQAAGLRQSPARRTMGPVAPQGYGPQVSPMAAFIHAARGQKYGTAAQVGGDQAYNAFMAQPQNPYEASRNAFNQQYGQGLGTAIASGRPGMGLQNNEGAAQMGGYQHMPNVTVGGAYGRGPSGYTGPAKAPWMNDANPITMGQYNQPQFASTAPAQSSTQDTFNARQGRADASGGRLIAQPGPVGGANRGNYQYSPGAGGINTFEMVNQNPAAFHGLSDEHKQQLMAGNQNPLAGIQAAYRQRQEQAQGELADRRSLVMQKAQGRTEARHDRMDGVTPEFKLQQQHLQNQNDMLAAQLGLQNRRLDQGDRGLDQKDKQFNAQLRAQVAVKAAEAGLDETQTEELMNRLGMGAGGNANVAPGAKGGLAKKDHKQFEKLASGDDPAVTARHLSTLVSEGKMTQEEADKKLNDLHPQGTLGWMLGYDPTRTTDDAGGWNNWWAGKQVDPKSGKRWKGSTMGEFFKNTPPWAPFTGQK